MNTTGLISIAMMIAAASTSFTGSAGAVESTGQDPRMTYMHVYGASLPPIGHVSFCQRNPSDCAPDIGFVRQIYFGTHDMRELQAVNDLVNQMVLPVTDQDLYGQLEYWSYPAGKGDCEDYVLLKRRILMERGWSQSALLITVVRDENGDGHAILTVRTDHGDMILDNKIPEVMAWNNSPYTFIKRQSENDPRTWVSLAPPNGFQAARTSGTKARQER